MAASHSNPAYAGLRSRMRQFVEQGKYAGVATLVWRGGEVVSFDRCGLRDVAAGIPIERDTIFRLASMSKPVTSAAALMLVEDGKLDLAAPLDRWLPEMADIAVLRTPGSALDDVVPAQRPPTVFDLMTHSAGFAWGKGLDLPVCHAMNEATGTTPFVPYDADTLVRRVAALPLIQQPGVGWHYSNGTDLLGVLIARASGQSLPALLQKRIFDPLGMDDTGFWTPPENLDRLSVGYGREPGGLVVHDDARTGFWSSPPIFPAGGGGLVSTVDDYLAFARMLMSGGVWGGRRLLSAQMVARMTSSQLTTAQLLPLDPRVDFLQGRGFGFGLSASLNAHPGRRSPGSFSWPGGYGTTWFADPAEDVVAILMTQVWQDHLVEISPAFEGEVYAAIRGG